MDKFANYIDSLSARCGRSKVFNDFLTIAVCCLSMGTQEELYLKTIEPYTREELDTISKAFAALVVEMDNSGSGLKDILGEYFEEYFYNEKLGQFFTPPCICKLMADFTLTNGQNVNDPCCGSGRFFLAVAEKNRNSTFYGADISETCCKMVLINMCLNGLKCRISWMNTLSLEVYKEWAVVYQKFTNCPYIVEVKEIEKQNKEITTKQELQWAEHTESVDQNFKPFKFKRFIT